MEDSQMKKYVSHVAGYSQGDESSTQINYNSNGEKYLHFGATKHDSDSIAEGAGVRIYVNGDIKIGSWHNNMMHQLGRAIGSKCKEGYFQDDDIIGKITYYDFHF